MVCWADWERSLPGKLPLKSEFGRMEENWLRSSNAPGVSGVLVRKTGFGFLLIPREEQSWKRGSRLVPEEFVLGEDLATAWRGASQMLNQGKKV